MTFTKYVNSDYGVDRRRYLLYTNEANTLPTNAKVKGTEFILETKKNYTSIYIYMK